MTLIATSDDDWRLILAKLAGPAALDASARAHGALVRRRGVRDGASLLRLGLGYGPCGMSLREAAAWAEVEGIAALSDVALLNRLRGAADWYGALVGQLLAERAGVALDEIGARALRIVDGTAVRAPGSRGADWRLHAAYDPQAQRFTAFELSDGRGAERLERLPVETEEIRLADRGFGSRPEGLRALSQSAGDYVVRVGWRALHWHQPDGKRFDMLKFLRGLDGEAIGEAKVEVGRARAKRSWTPFPARLIAVPLPPEQAQASRMRARRAAVKLPARCRSDCGGPWGGSSAGRASRSQCEGREFDPPPLHHFIPTRRRRRAPSSFPARIIAAAGPVAQLDRASPS